MIGFLMLGSLVLGLISWILPIANIGRYKRNYNKNWAIYSIVSISACAVAICLQVMYSNYITELRDWSALMDTIPTSTKLSITLLIVTLILNGISVYAYHSKE